MEEKNSRRSVLKSIAGGAALLSAGVFVPGSLQAFETIEEQKNWKLKGRINHSVCKWCYGSIPLDEFCKAAKAMGISSVELLGPDEWPTLKKYGLTCAMPWGAGKGISEGFNDEKLHDELVASYESIFPKLAAAGYDKVICFSGNRRGISDEQGLQTSAKGLKRLMKSAEKYKVTMTMELLNSKVDHKDYQCDTTKWGVDLVKLVDSDNFKLLYDIYHMQIMEGDVIRTIKNNHKYFSHYHTGGVPGRNEIDATQELNYPAIMQAIIDTGYKGHVAQEFIPKKTDKLASLKDSIRICDV